MYLLKPKNRLCKYDSITTEKKQMFTGGEVGEDRMGEIGERD